MQILKWGMDFWQTVGIKIKEGRNFSDNANMRNEIVFNESAISAMGLKNPIGKKIKFWGQEKQIVGVAEDFNFESLYSKVSPAFFQMYPVMPNIIVKIKAGTEKQTIERVNKHIPHSIKDCPLISNFWMKNTRLCMYLKTGLPYFQNISPDLPS